jgi:CRISPR system Cascade subunit CasD
MHYLILKLNGPMQAWGEHTFEGKRPSSSFPTYSGIIGLLSACLGIKRGEKDNFKKLTSFLKIAVRIDSRKISSSADKAKELHIEKLTDFHTVKDARVHYHGLKSHQTIITWREYLFDASFSVAVWKTKEDGFSIQDIKKAVNRPVFTPFLGRRSCPITRPLFEKEVEAKNEFAALGKIKPNKGIIYSETPGTGHSIKVRDMPIWDQPRQFGSRIIYAHGG